MKKRYYFLTIILLICFTGSSWAQIKRAERLFKRFDYTKAIPVYERLANSNNKNSTLALSRLGDIYRLTSNYDKSAWWYQKATTSSTVGADTYFNYGQVLRSLGQYDEAIVQFDKFTKQVPTDNRGQLYADYCRQVADQHSTSKEYELVNLKSINSINSDFSPVVVNNEIVFTSDRTNGLVDKTYGWTGASYLDIYKAKSNSNDAQAYGSPEVLSADINMPYHDGPASFTADNNTIYFTRALHRTGVIDSSRFYTNKLKIYSSALNDGKWSSPQSFYLNDDSYSVGHPAISADGKTMYFVSDMPKGKGGTDLYSVVMVDGSWTNLKNLGGTVNSFDNEMFPFLENDSTLYFASSGWPGLGSLDVFKSKLINGVWSIPENCKEPINSPADDFGYYKDLNSGMIYLSSNRPGGMGADDIYLVSEKYADSVLITGLVVDKETGAILPNSTVFAWDVNSEDVSILITDENGKYSINVKPGSSYAVKSAKEGYSTDQLNFTIPELTREYTHDNRDLQLVRQKVNQIFEVANIYYDFDKYAIRQDAAKELDDVVSFLKSNPDITVELGSHTDSRGYETYNMNLSNKRAESAVSYILDHGISKERITAKGYGESLLVNKCDNSNCTEAEHQGNRRTEIKITGIKEESNLEIIESLESFKQGQKISVKQLDNKFFTGGTTGKEI